MKTKTEKTKAEKATNAQNKENFVKVVKISKKEAKSVELPKAKEQKVIKEVETQQQASLIEVVNSHREVKYIYPEEIQDTLSRKKWRQQVRNKLEKLERTYLRIQDQTSKEYKEAKANFDAFRSQVLKPAAPMV